jgi:hypothetical protein
MQLTSIGKTERLYQFWMRLCLILHPRSITEYCPAIAEASSDFRRSTERSLRLNNLGHLHQKMVLAFYAELPFRK